MLCGQSENKMEKCVLADEDKKGKRDGGGTWMSK